MKWQDISVDIKTLAPGGCLPLPRGYIQGVVDKLDSFFHRNIIYG